MSNQMWAKRESLNGWPSNLDRKVSKPKRFFKKAQGKELFQNQGLSRNPFNAFKEFPVDFQLKSLIKTNGQWRSNDHWSRFASSKMLISLFLGCCANQKKAVTDNFVFRLHYKATKRILFVLSLLIGLPQLFKNPVVCKTENPTDDFPSSYCALHPTFIWLETDGVSTALHWV